ncbi:hypothetical protein AVBRAN9333_06725 [Campylobacter sp. RM9333]|uniref:hypothetical protein n=1 Tax=Campylobacter sp. RM9333 TaxID=2735731 RepID=UPI001D5A1133|nr:hypothetical protein [Campylobacter sp. RM9333]
MNATILFSQIQDKLPKKIGGFKKALTANQNYSKPIMSNEELLKKLENLSETELDEVAKMLEKDKLDSPNVCFWLHNFLLGAFGVSRFKVGHFKIGIIKLLILIIYQISYIATLLIRFDPQITFIFYLLVCAFWFIDLFSIGVFLRNKNLEKVNNIIDLVKARNAN